MRGAGQKGAASKFLGVRLTAEELERLDRYGETLGLANRSEAARALVRTSGEAAAGGPELPVSLADQIDAIVEDGWTRSRDAAVTLVLTLGLQELAKLHAERLPALRERARENADRRRARRRADREGRGLLER